MDISQLNWLAVIGAAIAAFPLGALWYGPLFGNVWMTATGITKEGAGQTSMPAVFGGALVLNLIIAASLAMFIGAEAGWAFGLFAGFMAGFTFVAMALGVIYLFESRSLKLWAVNGGYQIVVFSVMGVILGAWS